MVLLNELITLLNGSATLQKNVSAPLHKLILMTDLVESLNELVTIIKLSLFFKSGIFTKFKPL